MVFDEKLNLHFKKEISCLFNTAFKHIHDNVAMMNPVDNQTVKRNSTANTQLIQYHFRQFANLTMNIVKDCF